jgi:hypothetical protein
MNGNNFEVFAPVRRGRIPEVGARVRLTARTETNGNGTLRLNRAALELIGINPVRGDHFYFLIEADRESGALRLTPTRDSFSGRLMNPMNRQITLPKSFFEWTGWPESIWEVVASDNGLVGGIREDARFRGQVGADA